MVWNSVYFNKNDVAWRHNLEWIARKSVKQVLGLFSLISHNIIVIIFPMKWCCNLTNIITVVTYIFQYTPPLAAESVMSFEDAALKCSLWGARLFQPRSTAALAFFQAIIIIHFCLTLLFRNWKERQRDRVREEGERQRQVREEGERQIHR